MPGDVLAVSELSEAGFRKITYETVSQGRRMADALGGELAVAVIGTCAEGDAAALKDYGADKIHIASPDGFHSVFTDQQTDIVASLAEKTGPSAIVVGATTLGKELAARLAARLDAPLAMDCIGIDVRNDALVAVRSMYGGKVLAEISLVGTPGILAVRPNSFAVSQARGRGETAIIEAGAGGSTLSFIEKTMDSDKIELTEADFIVSGGRGMGGSDYAVLEELAELLDGSVGASRSAVDEGWRPYSNQVGQTGKVVSPNVYIACGISGAIQHLAGMSSSRVIVAVNKDPDAPIFSRADYGIVGDVFDIVPHISAAVRKLKKEKDG